MTEEVRHGGGSFTIYAGSLDEPAGFKPTIAFLTRGRPDWASIPAQLKAFERGPSEG
jgi:hypothetical protein